MISRARLKANRANAQRSSGPRTIEGKRRSAQNALKHGFRAQSFGRSLDDDAAEVLLSEFIACDADQELAATMKEIIILQRALIKIQLRREERIEALTPAAGQGESLPELIHEIETLSLYAHRVSSLQQSAIDQHRKLEASLSQKASRSRQSDRAVRDHCIKPELTIRKRGD